MHWEGGKVSINERSMINSRDVSSDGLTLWRTVVVVPGRHVRGPEMVLSESSEVTASDTSSIKREADVAAMKSQSKERTSGAKPKVL